MVRLGWIAAVCLLVLPARVVAQTPAQAIPAKQQVELVPPDCDGADCKVRATVVAAVKSGPETRCWDAVVTVPVRVAGSATPASGMFVDIGNVDRPDYLLVLGQGPQEPGRLSTLCAPVSSLTASGIGVLSGGMAMDGSLSGSILKLPREPGLFAIESLGRIKLNIMSQPPGADLWLDGRSLGSRTNNSFNVAGRAARRLRLRAGDVQMTLDRCQIEAPPIRGGEWNVRCAFPRPPPAVQPPARP